MLVAELTPPAAGRVCGGAVLLVVFSGWGKEANSLSSGRWGASDVRFSFPEASRIWGRSTSCGAAVGCFGVGSTGWTWDNGRGDELEVSAGLTPRDSKLLVLKLELIFTLRYGGSHDDQP
jgi:hypothetical protein